MVFLSFLSFLPLRDLLGSGDQPSTWPRCLTAFPISARRLNPTFITSLSGNLYYLIHLRLGHFGLGVVRAILAYVAAQVTPIARRRRSCRYIVPICPTEFAVVCGLFDHLLYLRGRIKDTARCRNSNIIFATSISFSAYIRAGLA